MSTTEDAPAVHAITCNACGGAVALEAGRRLPRCLYCGSEALVEEALDERIEQPKHFIPFQITPEQADHVFRKFTRSSFWYPAEIRRAKLKMDKLLLPAWAWAGHLETHYAALVKAPTRSGKAPVTGMDEADLEGVVVPSSTALTREELLAIAPFEHAIEQPFDPSTVTEPYEPGKLSRSVAREQAVEHMMAAHANLIKDQTGAVKVNTSCICGELTGRPVLLPVYIGAWRFKDRYYRVLINGQTGRLHGKAPISWKKVALVVGAVLAALGLIALVVAAAGVISNL